MMNSRIIADITDFIFVSDEPARSDVIFLPGGSDPAIPEKAAELYKSGFAPFLLPSGGKSAKTGKFNGVKLKNDIYNGDYQTDCAFYTDVLIKNGVPPSAIIAEDKSGYTKENAALSHKAADEYGLTVRKALLVCKSFHARRCLMCYQFAFPEANIRVVPVDVYNISRDDWHTRSYGIDRVMGELARCGEQFIDEMKRA
jgi:uncharacterized SAM-binding protein YcdF (DUF218 family)